MSSGMPSYSLQASRNETPTHIYLLQMDSILNQTANDSIIFPLQIHTTGSDHNNAQLYVQKNDRRDKLEDFNDACQQGTVTFDNLHIEKYSEPGQKLLCVTSKELSEPMSQSEIVAPSLVNSSEKTVDVNHKQQVVENYIHISDRSVLPRAIAVLPSVLQIRRRDIITPKRSLSSRTRFGPVIGIRHKISHLEADELVMKASTDKTPLFMHKDENKFITHIDVSDKDKSNWIGLLPLGDNNSANVWIYEEDSELFIITTETITSRKQLLLGYSKKYAEDYGLSGPIKDIEIEFSNVKSWWCYECHRALPSSTLLQRHMNAYHQEYKPNKRRRYRCRNCMLTFSRLFALRRHIGHHCKKKFDKSGNVNKSGLLPDDSLNSTLNAEDNRIPSDESFQNYSNGLDFPTNLFDTDRIPSLDMSGNSRSEVFNPYLLDGENALANDLEYGNGNLNNADNNPTTIENENNCDQQNKMVTVTSCSYCNQDIVKGKMRRHVSECPARRFECECKKVFTSKEKLAHHIYTLHTNKRGSDQQENDVVNTTSVSATEDPTPYKCEQCQHAFKRRGMLIKHLWRKHDTVSAVVPIERPIHHYPCVACPKIYRTATKRNQHIKIHHPGASRVGARSVLGGKRSCAPASCPVCPLQYTTRAKMLQHCRRQHPDTAITSKEVNLTEKSSNNVLLQNNELNATTEELIKNNIGYQKFSNLIFTD